MHFDGSRCEDWSRIALTSPKGTSSSMLSRSTLPPNNAPGHGTCFTASAAKEIASAHMLRNSDLVVRRSREWDARDANMASYRFLIQQLSGPFESCEFHHVPRAENEAVDTLEKIGSTRAIPAASSKATHKPPIRHLLSRHRSLCR
ncbi:hypothetical protein ZWY2020_003004 [Hordeum vulgare]|nr:hypothetical protein ZWY2020_003004 [Hordeum vulgare]